MAKKTKDDHRSTAREIEARAVVGSPPAFPRIIATDRLKPGEAIMVGGPIMARDVPVELCDFLEHSNSVGIVVDRDARTIRFDDCEQLAFALAIARACGKLDEQTARSIIERACRDLAAENKAAKIVNIGTGETE